MHQVLHRTRFIWLVLGLCCMFVPMGAVAQTYYDNETQYKNQDPNNETRRSEHFRFNFGHYNRDTGTPMTEALAQGNLQMFEHMWDRWVTEMGLHDINESSTKPDGKKYKTNFNTLMTWDDGGGGGAYMSSDANGFAYCMANTGYCRFDPPSGATPHEMGHVWEGTTAGFNGTDSSGSWWECTANWMMLQFNNSYPQCRGYITNGIYYPAHGRDYYDSWAIWEAARDDSRYGAQWVNRVWTDYTPDQQAHEFILDRMIRIDASGSPDKAGSMKDLWGEMTKKFITWDYERQQWLAQANLPDDGSDWGFYASARTPLVKVPGTTGLYRPAREHLPMQFGFNLIPLAASPNTTVSCNFQPICDPVRQSDWRACLVAVSNNGDARYSCLWNNGTNSITLSSDETKLYLTVIATPKPMKIADPAWKAYLTDAGLQFPYAVSFTNASPKHVVYPSPTGTGKTRVNPDGSASGYVSNSATVDATAYVGANAMVLDSAQVLGNARVEEYAVVKNNAQIRDNAVVSGHAVVQDSAQVYGNAKVRDWARLANDTKLFDNAKAIEHAYSGGNGNVIFGNAIIKGTASVYSPSTFSGSLICDGDTANGGTGTKGVHFGWQWGQNPSIFTNLTDNGYVYAQHTFEKDNAVFAMDQYGINHGILMNGARVAKDTAAPTRGGLVLPLDGVSQYVELHNSVNDWKDTAITVWAKWTGTATDQRVWSMGNGSNKYMYLTPKDGTTSKLRFVISNGTITQSLDGTAAMPANTWTHVAVVFSGTTSTLYVNGASVASNASTTVFPEQLNAPLMENANYLGRGNAGNYFAGCLDDFRVYMKALTASQVSAVYSAAAPGAVNITADIAAPTPNAATWLVNPVAISDSAITMSATPGTDASNWVEYYYDCTSGGGHDSGWISMSKYTDVGIAPGTACTYTVKMRDKNGNTTAASVAASATTQTASVTTPSFAYGPVGIADGKITMTATKVASPSGLVEYKFDRVVPGVGTIASSGWQSSPTWTNTGLTTGSSNAYTVTIRDGRGNVSAASAARSAVARDMAAPKLPIAVAHWTTQPYATIDNKLCMTAMDTSDPAGVQYYFHCVSGGGPDSGWLDSPVYTSGVVADGTYVYQYKVRDKSAQYNETGYSTTSSATVSGFRGYHTCEFAQLSTLPDDYLVKFTGTVVTVNADSYIVKDTASSATVIVRPDTYAQATDPTFIFKNVNVSGHLYTFSGVRHVTFAKLSITGSSQTFNITGKVIDSAGNGIPGATVSFSSSPNAATNPATTTTTDESGNYVKPMMAGTWYVAASSPEYFTSADRVAVVSTLNVHNVDFTLASRPKVTGKVTDRTNGGTPVAGATVCFSTSPNPAVSPTYTATTDASGNYSQVLTNGTWYACAGKVNYNTTADQTVVVNGRTDNVDFAMTVPGPKNAPRTEDLLFSTVTDSLPPTGNTGPWATYSPAGQTLTTIGTPTVDTINTVKWVKNQYNDNDGYRLGTYSSPIPVNGASIVVAVKPIRNGIATAWTSVVDVFYDRLVLGVKNDTGRVCVRRNGSNDLSATAIPNGQLTVLSLVVQPDGKYKVYANGVQIMDNTTTNAMTSLVPNVPGTYANAINVGRNNPDGWTTFNGDIGDVFLYKVALSDAERQQLENALTGKIYNTGTKYTITASAGAGGAFTPGGAVSVDPGANQTFTVAPNPGYTMADVVVDGTSVGAVSSYTFENVNANHTISATFTPIPAFTVTATAGAGGTISPSGAVTVYSGASQTFTIATKAGYGVGNVKVDGVDKGAVGSYTFDNVTANHTIDVTFTNLGRNIPRTADLLFSVVSDSLPASGNITGWPVLCPAGKTLARMNTPTAETLGGVKWEKNIYADADGFDFGNFASSPIAVNGASIVLVAKPSRTTQGTSWTSIVDIFYDRLMIGIVNDTGQVVVRRNGNLERSSVTIPSGQITVLSMVVQPTGEYRVWANGDQIMSNSTASDMTSLVPGVPGGFANNINIGRNGPDGWTTFNGNIGDVFVYKVALSDAERLTLEADVKGKFNGLAINASAGPGGAITPNGLTTVAYAANQSYTITPQPGYSVADVVVDGDSVGAVRSYTFTNVTSEHSIVATFAMASQTVSSIAALKAKPADTLVTLTSTPTVIYAPKNASNTRSTTFFYIGENQAMGGLRVVDKTSDSLTVGNKVANLTGYVRKPAGQEAYLELTADVTGTGITPIAPIGVNNKSVLTDAKVLTNAVRVWGKVKSVNGTTSFVISDGYNASGVTVITHGVALPTGFGTTKTAVVTGLVTKDSSGNVVVLAQEIRAL